jgi:phosphoribosylformylglycinamidine synthase
MPAVRARVHVFPRPEILDPQGKAVSSALGRLGFEQVVDVRAGKSFDIEFAAVSEEEARSELDEMCRRLLANPVIEDYSFELLGPGGPAGGEP